MEGLAAQAGMPGGQEEMVQQIVQLLMQGVDPEELVQQGVPVEAIKEAIQLIMAAQQQEQGVQPDSRQEMGEPGEGLARASMGGM